MEDIIVDQMTKEEASVCLEWAKSERWNPGLHDADVFYETDKNGFFAARSNGEMVGGISVVSYSSGYKFGGLLIVRPDIRHKGVGRLLISQMLRYSAGFNLGCDGVLQMVKKYESYGFIPAHENIRFVGKCVPNQSTTPGLVPISSVPQVHRRGFRDGTTWWFGNQRGIDRYGPDGTADAVHRHCHGRRGDIPPDDLAEPESPLLKEFGQADF